MTRAIPRTGERLPVLGLGTWQKFDVGRNAAARVDLAHLLRDYVTLGGSVLDTSPMYRTSEAVIGDLVEHLGLRRHLFLATKVWTYGRWKGRWQVLNSLGRMRTRRIDLMQVHNLEDVTTHAKMLRGWQASGRVRYIGITHYQASAHPLLASLIKTGEWDFAQFNYSIADREAERRLLPMCADYGVAVLVNMPLGQGRLFERVKDRPLPPWAPEMGCSTWAQFCLKYVISNPAVTCVIPATRSQRHLTDNMRAAVAPLPDAATRARMVQYFESL